MVTKNTQSLFVVIILAIPHLLLALSAPFKPPFQAQQLPPTATAAATDNHDGQHASYTWERLPLEDSQNRADEFYNFMGLRRTVRFFSKDPVPLSLLQTCIATAGTAPSGAHQQPWTFCVVQDPDTKQKIRDLVEEEERLNYEARMSEKWKDELQPILSGLHATNGEDGTVVSKPYLTDAPYIVVLMKQINGGIDGDGATVMHYYVDKSCGICAGIFSTALHNANLATLCSTPLHAEEGIRSLLDRPKNERVFLLMPVGYPSKECTVPYRGESTQRKPLEDIMKVF